LRRSTVTSVIQNTATERNRRAVERYAVAWLAGDLDAILDCYADDFTLHYFGNNPFTGDHVGKQASLDTLLEVGARAPRTLLSVDEILAGPQSAGMVVTERIMVDEVPHEIRRFLRFRITGLQLVECWLLEEQQRLVDQAWRDRLSS